MSIKRIYLGTWLPRTHIHLAELHHFLRFGTANNLDKEKSLELQRKLNIQNLTFHHSKELNSIKFDSGDVSITVTEDGIIAMKISEVKEIADGIKKIEEFYSYNLGPAFSFLFSKGAPLPQTLVDLKEVYPKIFVGKNISESEIDKIFQSQHSELLSEMSTKKLKLYYGEETEVIETAILDEDEDFDSLINNLIFIQSYTDLLRKYLVAHRSVWSEISLLREARGLRYHNFPLIRSKILDFLKTISFIQARIKQMDEIAHARNLVTSETVKERLVELGVESFEVLKSSSDYFSDLWQMTADYANSTLVLFETLVSENTQREIRILQIITVAGMLVGFFGMNIAFPWEERWPDIFASSFVVFGIIILSLIAFNWILKVIINQRLFKISDIS